jgi:hypothetical protein
MAAIKGIHSGSRLRSKCVGERMQNRAGRSSALRASDENTAGCDSAH